MSLPAVENAIVDYAEIGPEGHGILTVSIGFKMRGASQGLPQCALDNAALAVWVKSLLRVASVEKWSQMVGRPVRIRRDQREMIVAVGHIIEDDWFDYTQVSEALR